MKEKVKAAVVQFAPGWLQRERNAERMAEWAAREAEAGVELVVFPELSNLGFITPVRMGEKSSFDEKTTAMEFLVKYRRAAEPVPGPTTEVLSAVARKRNIFIVAGLAQAHPQVPGTLYNSAVLIGPPGLIGLQHKVHIPNNERWFFYAGAGPQVFETDLGRIGMSICYDGHFFPEVNRLQGLQGAEIICQIANVPKVTHFTHLHGRRQPFPLHHIAYTRALENATYFLMCNRTGLEGGAAFAGGSAIARPDGRLIAATESDEEISISAELLDEEVLYARSSLTVYRDRRPALYGQLIEPLASGATYRPEEMPGAER